MVSSPSTSSGKRERRVGEAIYTGGEEQVLTGCKEYSVLRNRSEEASWKIVYSMASKYHRTNRRTIKEHLKKKKEKTPSDDRDDALACSISP